MAFFLAPAAIQHANRTSEPPSTRCGALDDSLNGELTLKRTPAWRRGEAVPKGIVELTRQSDCRGDGPSGRRDVGLRQRGSNHS